MSTALTTQPPQTVGDQREQVRLVKNLILRNASDDQVQLVLGICRRYGLDPLLKHAVLISGALYVTRDGLIRIAHASGQLDGIETEATQDAAGQWIATCRVWRKDMSKPFVYTSYQREHQNPNSSAWKSAPRAMTVKAAEVMCLRRAFDISLGAAEEVGYDGATPLTNAGQVQVIETNAIETPATETPSAPTPAKPRKRWTVEMALAEVANAQQPRERRLGFARWILDQAGDLDTLAYSYSAIAQWFDDAEVVQHFDARWQALEAVQAPVGTPAPSARVVDADGVVTSAPPPPATPSDEELPRSEPQNKMLHALAGRAGLDHDALNAWCQEHYGKPAKALSRREASLAIDAIRQLPAVEATS